MKKKIWVNDKQQIPHCRNSSKILLEYHRNTGKINTPNVNMTAHSLVQAFQ